MQLILAALRRPISVLIFIVGIVLVFLLAVGKPLCQGLGLPFPRALPQGMEVDIFPSLDLPVIYVCQPYGGMDPAQMEGFLTNYYEYHFLYITGIHHVESQNIQGVALMKLFFHPGTNMAQAMAETINYVNRSQAFMPPGTVSPFVMRFDTGSVPVGRLVLSSETRTIAEIQDLALFLVRPIFSSLPGVSAPPPFGGSQRTVVVTLDPHRLLALRMSPAEVIEALGKGNRISPSGNLPVGDKFPIVPVNTVVRDVRELEDLPIRNGLDSVVYLRDIGSVRDDMDAPTGYALVNGRRAVYILATKRADASTLSVVNEIKAAIPMMQERLVAAKAPDIRVSFEFDQTPYVTRGISAVVGEGFLGALLVGLMILLFLRDWRSALVVVLNIPLALMTAVVGLWLTGQTLNLMTLGGLALAIGILVDEATVAIENIHARLERGQPLARAVRDGAGETAVPRFLAMVCILAVFISSFFMRGAARNLFVPLSLAVGFAMIASYVLSSTFVPILSVWLLGDQHAGKSSSDKPIPFASWRAVHRNLLEKIVQRPRTVVAGYSLVSLAIILWMAPRLGMDIFPKVDAGQFRLRLRAPDGTHFGSTEQITIRVLEAIGNEVGKENVALTLGYVGTIPSSYPINAVFQWSRGPEDAVLWVDLKEGSKLELAQVQERLRQRLSEELPQVRFSFEPSDIVDEVMSFGSPTPVEVAVSGPSFAESRSHAEKIRQELARLSSLRDLQFGQSLDYPTIEVKVDRQRAGLAGVTASDVSNALVAATSSSRFVVPNFWAEPKSGRGYQVQVEVPRPVVRAPAGIETVGTIGELQTLTVRRDPDGDVLVRDVAEVVPGKMPGQFDRYNMQRQVTLTANVFGQDLGSVSRQVRQAIAGAGKPPAGVQVEVRGQIPPLQDILTGLGTGLVMAMVVIFLLLAANFQSLRLALVTVSTLPAVVAGVVLVLGVTGTTWNIQSLIGAIMATGVAMANAILLTTFSEHQRRAGQEILAAAINAAASRIRAVLMTSFAMIAGMLPMALALGEAGEQNAPLGRAVIGGLAVGTLATLLILPCAFIILQRPAALTSTSLDPDDPQSAYHDAANATKETSR